MRPAGIEDALDILRWRNDSLARAMSRNDSAVGKADHMAWFAQAVNDPNRRFLIGVLDGTSVGVVRFDCKGDSLWEVSITLAPEFRGKGLGRWLLGSALEHLHSEFPHSSVIAVARLNNDASLKLFLGQGFGRENDDGTYANLVLRPNTPSLGNGPLFL